MIKNFLFTFLCFFSLASSSICQKTNRGKLGGNPIAHITETKKIAIQGFYIGVDSTEIDYLPNLAYANKDAWFISNFFSTNSLYEYRKPILLTNRNATKSAIQTKFSLFLSDSIQVKNTDRVLLFYAGHALKYHNNYYLAPYSAAIYDFINSMISLQELQNVIDQFTYFGIDVVLIIDACNSGIYLFPKLKDQYNNEGEVITLLSSGKKELAVEGRQWNNGQGLFTYYLIKGMEGEASQDKDDLVNFRELSRFLEDTVEKATDKKQRPRCYAEDEYTLISKIENIVVTQANKTERDSLYNKPDDSASTTIESSIRKNDQSFINSIKSKVDTFSLINELDIYRSKLIEDPFTLPKIERTLEIERAISTLLTCGLEEHDLFSQLEEDALLVKGMVWLSYLTDLEKGEGFRDNNSPSSCMDNEITQEELLQKAIYYFEKLLAVHKDNLIGWTLRANCYSELGQYQKAIEILDSALQIRPDYPNFYLARSWAYSKNNNNKKAKRNQKYFRRYVRKIIKPNISDDFKLENWTSLKQRKMILTIKNNKKPLSYDNVYPLADRKSKDGNSRLTKRKPLRAKKSNSPIIQDSIPVFFVSIDKKGNTSSDAAESLFLSEMKLNLIQNGISIIEPTFVENLYINHNNNLSALKVTPDHILVCEINFDRKRNMLQKSREWVEVEIEANLIDLRTGKAIPLDNAIGEGQALNTKLAFAKAFKEAISGLASSLRDRFREIKANDSSEF